MSLLQVAQNDSLNGDVWYTAKGDVVYAIALGWPENDVLKIKSPKAVHPQTKASGLNK